MTKTYGQVWTISFLTANDDGEEIEVCDLAGNKRKEESKEPLEVSCVSRSSRMSQTRRSLVIKLKAPYRDKILVS